MAAAAVALAVIGVAITSWLLVRTKLYQQFDAQLRSYAQLAAKAATPEEALATLRAADRRSPDTASDHSPGLTVQFLDRNGKPVMAGPTDVPAIPVSEPARQVAAGQLPDESEIVQLGPDRYRVWTVARPGGAAQVARDAEGVEHTLAELGLWEGLVGAVGVAGAAAVGRAVARAALRPVDLLTAGAERVARTQDLTAGIPVTGKGEIARLAEAFNAMLAALAESRHAQRRLVEDANHELRTPLTSLRNNVELLIHASAQRHTARILSPVDQARLLTDLDVQTVELTTLIGELVQLSREDTGPEPVERLEVAEVVGSAVERARLRAPHLRFETRLVKAEVDGRPAALKRAVLNLLDNAAKWSPADSTIRVSVVIEEEPSKPVARIAVADEGPGIPDKDLAHVFERFYRAEAARALPGSGLGLAIVEQTAALHGGSVRAVNAETGGAVVSLTVPLSVKAS
jgi:two-component system sensor histidine kinase MprB